MQKEPEMSFLSSAYARLTEETNSKFIDLGVKPNFISEDDALKRAEIYENLHMSPGSGFEPNLPDGHEINRTQINKPLRESRLLLEKSFLELTYAINEPIQVESFISTYI